ncbi:MAG: nucleotide-binding domain containing protein [Caulobacteraceae bacterium]
MDAIIAATLAIPRRGLGPVRAASPIPLARALSPGGAPKPEPVVRRAGPILVTVGSASSVSRRQLALLVRSDKVQTLVIPPRVLLEGPEGPGWRPASRALVAAVGKPGKDTVALAIDPSAPVDPAVGPALAASLGVLAGRQLGRFGALVATGGETARARSSARAGVQSLCFRREIEPGVVLSDAGALPVVTKAGAFGEPDSLARAVEGPARPFLLPSRPFGGIAPAMQTKPVIAITMGDASGVGPEIVAKALAHADLFGTAAGRW